MFELIIETDFAAAHNLREYKGQCERLHGHNWKVQVILKSEKLDKSGMVMDFRDAKRIIGEIMNRFDHVYLNNCVLYNTVGNEYEMINTYGYFGHTDASFVGNKFYDKWWNLYLPNITETQFWTTAWGTGVK